MCGTPKKEKIAGAYDLGLAAFCLFGFGHGNFEAAIDPINDACRRHLGRSDVDRGSLNPAARS
jgi:hypothetical protein